MEILKDIMPKLRRVATFYDPNPAAESSIKIARDAEAAQGGARRATRSTSVDDLRAELGALKPLHADALFDVSERRWYTVSSI